MQLPTVDPTWMNDPITWAHDTTLNAMNGGLSWVSAGTTWAILATFTLTGVGLATAAAVSAYQSITGR